MIEIQSQLSERAIELLRLPDEPCLVLDVGCGSGLSGECLTEQGHYWIGVDISSHMLDVAVERETEGDLLLGDMGYGMPFRPGTFDGIISISALQWLCNADKSYHKPPKRLLKFFSTLYACVRRGARAVFQLYPENPEQVSEIFLDAPIIRNGANIVFGLILDLELITQQAMKAGWTGGLVVDYPNSTKAKKMFLCLFAGGQAQALPKGLGTETSNTRPTQVSFSDKRERMKAKHPKKSRDWILEKKERRRRQGR
ncbi:hypothetical protein FSP39_002058 [Pinctada imbricata]|uniref:18S rRNA (Guanine-N(7))-methyltransferase n=1 Tax=Pinctada imbricata TaxID=66713 RepID=A0AA89BQF3_PINIB|nr:hypothetical protein FSP39_002058 [Pinctada imbricata]